MSATNSFSAEPSDILDDQVDSSPLLTSRLDSLRHAVSIVLNYANTVLHTQNSITTNLGKQHKAVADLPSFSGSSVTGGTVASGAASPQVASPASPASASFAGSTHASGSAATHRGTSAIAAAFQSLARSAETLLQESEQAAASIKQGVIPQLEVLESDLEKHSKTLRTQSHKLYKDVDKHRENTTKHLESLGRSVSVAHTGQRIDPKNDPYVLHRRVRSVAAEQIQRENQLAENNLNVQNNFASLEQHVIEVLQNSVASLNDLTQRFTQVSSNASATTEQRFAAISPASEWQQFKSANAQSLVPDSGYQRDPSRVTFANSDAETTKPIIEGTLSRKGTVLRGQKPGYYVLTPTGFLHEYKSGDYIQDAHPELSLFIPESEISGVPAPQSGDLSFKIVSKDANKVIATRHKYTFTASSYDELVAWHSAIAQVAGATVGASTLDSAEEDPGYYAGAPGSPTGGTEAAAFPQHNAETGIPAATGSAPSGLGATPGVGTAAGSGFDGADAAAGGLAGGALGAGVAGAGSGLHNQQPIQRDLQSEFQQPQSGLQRDLQQPQSGLQGGLQGGIQSEFQQPQSGLQRDLQQPQAGLQNEFQQQQSGLQRDFQQQQSGLQRDFQNPEAGLQSNLQSNFQQPLQRDLQSNIPSGHAAEAAGLGGAGLGGAGLGGAGLGGAGAGGTTNHHAYSRLAGESGNDTPQSYSAYNTPQQPSGASFENPTHSAQQQLSSNYGTPQQIGGAAFERTQPNPSTAAGRVEGLRLDSSVGAGNGGGAGSGYGSPRSPTQEATTVTGVTSVPRSPTSAHEPTYVSGSGPRSPVTDKFASPSTFQGSRQTSSASGFQGGRQASTASNVPHYQISPSKRSSINNEGLAAGGTFGSVPVESAAEPSAHRAVQEHDEKVVEKPHEHHHGLHLPGHHHHETEIEHKGHRHNPEEGAWASTQPAAGAGTGAGLAGTAGAAGATATSVPTTPRYDSARPTAAAQTYGSYGGSPKNAYGQVKPRDVEYSHPVPSEVSDIAAGSTNPLLGSGGRSLHANNIQPRDVPYSQPKPNQVSSIAAGSTNPLLDSRTSYGAPAANNNVQPGGGFSDLGSKAGQQQGYTGHARGPSLDGINHDTRSRLDPLSSRYTGPDQFQDARDSGFPQSQSGSYGSGRQGDYSHSQLGHQNNVSNNVGTHAGNTAGAYSSPSNYGRSSGPSSPAGATSGSQSQYRPYSSEQHASQYNGSGGAYSQKDYSGFGPGGSGSGQGQYGQSQYNQGVGPGAGQAQGSHGNGGKYAAAAGGLGAAGGLAGGAGIPGGNEVSQATGALGNLSSGGVKNAAINEIPGAGDVNQARNLASGNLGGAVKNDIPGVNQAQQFSQATNDLKSEPQNLENDFANDVEKEKPSGFKKLANVFKS